MGRRQDSPCGPCPGDMGFAAHGRAALRERPCWRSWLHWKQTQCPDIVVLRSGKNLARREGEKRSVLGSEYSIFSFVILAKYLLNAYYIKLQCGWPRPGIQPFTHFLPHSYALTYCTPGMRPVLSA